MDKKNSKLKSIQSNLIK